MSGWIEPPDPRVPGEYWLTRRSADAASGYDLELPDIRVQRRWAPQERAWITGEYPGRQRMEAKLGCFHSNNGWRLEGPA